MRKYFLEGFLAIAGAAACAAVATHMSATLWTVMAALLGGVGVACFAASLRPRVPTTTATDDHDKPHRRHRPRRLGTRGAFGSSPTTNTAPTPRATR
ncbi:hypothetical protein CLV40_101181 [Actinokineospora auranticolor]|uniref:Secreted protein with PEP-CTERM sorting signal n=1 Tax=Actinokineospora auranticolor TaxID=155976 RepID=A0A2S6H0I7_9PSEU|nr:hypothetical protein CLV40_101181 [Actinokineospora auranticolor]